MKRAAALSAVAALLLAGASPAAAPRRVPKFRHVFVVVFENKERAAVLGSPDAPTFNRLARRYAVLSNYRAVAHPSLPNYLALVSGSTQGITSDCTECIVSASSLANSLDARHLSWKTYAEGLPEAGSTVAFSGGYAKKHDPFLYFRSVADDAARRANIVPLTQLDADLRAHRLPHFALVVPDLCHDMHDCSVAAGDQWLHSVIEPLLSRRDFARSVVFVVFDESSVLAGVNDVPALALGPAVRPHARFARTVDHYGLLRTVEDAWGLPRLGASASARPIVGIWR